VIEIIVSDLGKVLLPFDTEPVWKLLEEACPECDSPRETFQRIYAEADIGRGKTDPEEFHRRLAEALKMTLSYDDFSRVWSDMFEEDPETIGLILSAPVRERHMLSNTNAIHWKWIRDNYGEMLSGFDRLWVSHEMGLEKPDPAIYLRVIEATGLPPEAHVFIDDIAENVEAARSVGMEGIVHTDAPSLAKAFDRLGLRK
jgi:putative hydrolase of the HAD superfamily